MTRAIQPLILCRKCKGAGSLNGEPCPRCEEHPGTDPESYRGCVGHEHAKHACGFEPGTDGKTAIIRL